MVVAPADPRISSQSVQTDRAQKNYSITGARRKCKYKVICTVLSFGHPHKPTVAYLG
jgi:hypothetical protein